MNSLQHPLRQVRKHRVNRAIRPLVEPIESRVLMSVSISGSVFNDLNGNGVHDAGELPLKGSTVFIDLNHNGKYDAGSDIASVTNASGEYSFKLAPGTYEVVCKLPGSDWRQTLPKGGNSAEYGVALDDNQVVEGLTFLNQQYSISGTVFNDVNSSGILDGGETGLGGFKVSLYQSVSSSNNLIGTTTSDANGVYGFANLGAGTYYAYVTNQTSKYLPTGKSKSYYQFKLAIGAHVANNNFGEHLIQAPPPPPTTGTISGEVFNDLNANGMLDSGEPGIPGFTIRLYETLNGGTKLVSTYPSTDLPGGTYHFSSLSSGTYYVYVQNGLSGYQPTGKSLTYYRISLTAGMNSANNNFGEH